MLCLQRSRQAQHGTKPFNPNHTAEMTTTHYFRIFKAGKLIESTPCTRRGNAFILLDACYTLTDEDNQYYPAVCDELSRGSRKGTVGEFNYEVSAI